MKSVLSTFVVRNMKRILENFRNICSYFGRSQASIYASAASFYILLSIPSSTVLLLSILRHIPQLEAYTDFLLNAAVPSTFLNSFSHLFQESGNSAATLLPVSAVITAWSAAKGTTAVIDGLCSMFDLPAKNYFARRFRGILSLIGLSLATVIMGFLIVFCYILLYQIVTLLPPLQHMYSFIIGLRSMFAFLLFSFIYSGIYAFVYPGARSVWGILSGCVTALSCIILSEGFSLYVRWISENRKPLSTIQILLTAMLWLRLIILLLHYGAIACKLLARNYDRHRKK